MTLDRAGAIAEELEEGVMKIAALPSAFVHSTSNFRNSTERMLPFWIAAAITAAVSVFYAKIFGWSEEFAFHWFEKTPELVFLATPVALLASALLALYFAPFASGSGIPQLLVAVEISRASHPLLQKILSVPMMVVKFLGSCICVAGGGVSGREGPMLQISAGIFNWVQRVWPRSQAKPNLQSMILAGGAAGLASAFNTPLGGVIFAIEELAKVHISVIRSYVFHSVIIAGLLAQALLGNYLYFGKIQNLTSSVNEVFPLMIRCALIGLLGALFGKATVYFLDWRSKISFKAKVLMTLVCGLFVAGLSYSTGVQALGGGRSVIIDLLSQADTSQAPLSLGIVRGVSNFLTYTAGVVGGIFAPALSTGAALGSWLGQFAPVWNQRIWILSGMVAFLTGVTRTPFTSLILVLEMTDTHNVIIDLMLSAIVSQSVAKLVDPKSFYEHMSHRILASDPLTSSQKDT